MLSKQAKLNKLRLSSLLDKLRLASADKHAELSCAMQAKSIQVEFCCFAELATLGLLCRSGTNILSQ